MEPSSKVKYLVCSSFMVQLAGLSLRAICASCSCVPCHDVLLVSVSYSSFAAAERGRCCCALSPGALFYLAQPLRSMHLEGVVRGALSSAERS